MISFLIACALSNIEVVTDTSTYHVPSTPTSYWIWESLEAAQDWDAIHSARICIARVPDGWATKGC